MYDIGLSADDISDGDMISLYPFIFDGEQENNGRDLPLVNGQPDEYGNHILVIKVYGHMLRAQ